VNGENDRAVRYIKGGREEKRREEGVCV